jgi:acetyl-CoA synthetase
MLVVNAWHPDLLAEGKLGSLGRALPGFTVEILRSDADEITLTGEVGRVATDRAPSSSAPADSVRP